MDSSVERAVIVTGAGKGLGAAFAKALASEGTAVLVNNRLRKGQPDSAGAVADSIRANGGRALANYQDIAAPGAAQALVKAALEAFGRIDAIVFNAGIIGPAAKLPDMDMTALGEVLNTNFVAQVALAQAALPHLLQGPAGRMVFVSSSAGLHGVRGRIPYAASKGALNSMALTLADELKRTPIRVNVLCPYASTPMTAQDGVAGDPRLDPAYAAGMAAYLASEACSVNGQIFLAGGRRYRRAHMVEGRGASAPDDSTTWVAEHLEQIASMDGAREFPGAESAFADLYASIDITSTGE
ncbi:MULTISPECIES: SDR family NAD(P)-dependent oxidoreductase [Pseudomonadota]|jgi:NAD(P)-dependent dehydrogenase (short-subunit alcohol dehydrogenase family)|uniref:SDR family NAD(P)-dependent oxidoreductase n=3 Tax=Pseudomonadota TaxID=1224 RepID=UPI00076AD2B0|nr:MULTISPECIES: SDR family NAD(P)-dependent oxidoreductase [Pseudomonadota]MAF61017.1 short-chain dehydrogenase [Blastomonas sp.]|tara:strand:- start:125126 stop:126019 length:894 start_codon:yes stop_codon:yes gene_type:complete